MSRPPQFSSTIGVVEVNMAAPAKPLREIVVDQSKCIEASAVPTSEPECMPQTALPQPGFRDRASRLPPIEQAPRAPSLSKSGQQQVSPGEHQTQTQSEGSSSGFEREEHTNCASWKLQKVGEWSQEQGFSPSEVGMQVNLSGEDKTVWFAFLVEQYMQASRTDGDKLDSWLEDVKKKQNISAGLLTIPFPFLAAMRSKRCKLVLFLIAVLSATLLSVELTAIAFSQQKQTCSIRISAVKARGQNQAPVMHNVADLKPTEAECILRPALENASGNAIVFVFSPHHDEKQWETVDGFSYITAGSDPDQDPVLFEVERMDSEGGWDSIRRPHSLLSPRQWRAQPAVARGHKVTVRWVEEESVWLVCVLALVAAGSLLALYYAAMDHIFLARQAVSWCSTATAIALWAAAVRFSSDDYNTLDAIPWWRGVVASSLLSYGLVVRDMEQWLGAIMCAAPLLDLVVVSCLFAARGRHAWGFAAGLASKSLALPVVMFGFGAFLVLYVRMLISKLRRRGREDEERYDTIWKAVLEENASGRKPIQRRRSIWNAPRSEEASKSDDGREGSEAEEPDQLQRFLGVLNGMSPPKDAPALQRIQEDGDEESVMSTSLSRRPSFQGWLQGPRGAVQSLDQLYAQAACGTLLLREQVQRLARDHGGMFPTEMPKRQRADTNAVPRKFERWDELCERVGEAAAASRVFWTENKQHKRAIEKVLWRYHGDVSRLLDVCRESIVFGSLSDMTSCLADIAVSSSLAVDRVRNSLSPDVDASRWSGFRAVVLNLRITTPIATGLGVAGHVCELVLLLHPFAVCQSLEAHDDYLALRSLDQDSPPRFKPSLRFTSLSSVMSLLRRSSSSKVGPTLRGLARVASTAYAMPSFPISSAEPAKASVDEQFCILLACYRRRVLCPSGVLDRRKCCIQKAASKAELLALFRSSYPIASALSKRSFRVFFLFLAAAFASYAALNLTNEREVSADMVRFRAIELRGGKPAQEGGAAIANSIGVLHHQCHHWLAHPEISDGGMTWTYRLEGGRRLHGFSFVTNSDDPLLDPVVFAFEVSDRTGWKVAAASGKFIRFVDNSIAWRTERSNTPMEREAKVDITLGPPSSFWILSLCSSLGVAVMCLVLCSLGVFHKYMLGRPVLVGGILSRALFKMMSAVTVTMHGAYRGFPMEWADAAMLVGGAMTICFRERLLIEAAFLYSFSFVMLQELELRLCWPGHSPEAFARIAPLTVAACSATALVLRRLLGRRVHRNFVQGQLDKYQAAWTAVIADPRNRSALHRIAECLACVHQPPGGAVRQMHPPPLAGKDSVSSVRSSPFRITPVFSPLQRRGLAPRVGRSRVAPAPSSAELETDAEQIQAAHEAAGGEGPQGGGERLRCFYLEQAQERGGVWSTFSGTLTRRVQAFTRSAPVTSLDLLYSQAIGLHPLLKRKVQEWALASRGCFSLRNEEEGRPRYVRWEDAVREREQHCTHGTASGVGGSAGEVLAVDRIKWAAVKSPERAIEKLVRVYGGNVSCLLDVCRQSIVFDRCDELAQCLETIVRDRHAIVLGFKNRLRVDYNAEFSGGYRDVQLKLVLVTREAEKLGLSHHVCEVQLLLTDFAHVKNEVGHKKYVEARDAKAE